MFICSVGTGGSTHHTQLRGDPDFIYTSTGSERIGEPDFIYTSIGSESICEPDFIYTNVQADAQHRPRRSRLERAAHNGYGSYHTQMA